MRSQGYKGARSAFLLPFLFLCVFSSKLCFVSTLPAAQTVSAGLKPGCQPFSSKTSGRICMNSCRFPSLDGSATGSALEGCLTGRFMPRKNERDETAKIIGISRARQPPCSGCGGLSLPHDLIPRMGDRRRKEDQFPGSPSSCGGVGNAA